MDRTDETWKPSAEIPGVQRGCECEFIVAVRRARNGKTYSFSASYLNAYPLRYDYGCPKGENCSGGGCDDGCPTTGWFSQTGDDDESSQYNKISLDVGDELVAWRHVPQYSEQS